MWIRIFRPFPAAIEKKIEDLIGGRQDKQDNLWLDMTTGARLILAANGGWRTASESAYYAFYVSPTGEVIDVTLGILDGKVPFDAAQTGNDSFTKRRAACVEHIERLLGVQSHHVNYGNITPVRSL